MPATQPETQPRDEQPTQPPTEAEAYAVGVFEAAITRLGEWDARLLNLAIKMGVEI